MKKKILLACEESQTVCKAFRNKGYIAFSCDIENESGGRPEWHIKDDVFNIIEDNWFMMIAFPPCTYLSSVQTFLCRKDEERVKKRIEAAKFFMDLYTAPINHICIENPTGVMTHIFRAADQIIHPFYFGGDSYKRTGLWLKNMPKLTHSKNDNLFEKQTFGNVKEPTKTWIQQSTGKIKHERSVNKMFLSSKERSKLSPFIANAMASQWSYLLD